MTAKPDTTTCYRVTYAAAGCLPDSDPVYFDSIDEACEHVADERAGICWMGPEGYREDASMSAGDIGDMLIQSGRVPDPTPGSTYAWSIETLERAEEPTNAYLGWVCGNCIGHLANGECGDCPHEGLRDPLSHFEYGQRVTPGMFPIHHADDCPAHYGEVDVECECEVTEFSHDRCDGCGDLPGERHAVTVWVEVKPDA